MSHLTQFLVTSVLEVSVVLSAGQQNLMVLFSPSLVEVASPSEHLAALEFHLLLVLLWNLENLHDSA